MKIYICGLIFLLGPPLNAATKAGLAAKSAALLAANQAVEMGVWEQLESSSVPANSIDAKIKNVDLKGLKVTYEKNRRGRKHRHENCKIMHHRQRGQ